MKRSFLIIAAVLAIVLVGCTQKKSFDTSLILGKWVTGTEYWVFETGGVGHTWNTADDVEESEATQMTWSVSGDCLTITLIGEMGQQVPKVYTISELTKTTFRYGDAYGKVYSLTRVE